MQKKSYTAKIDPALLDKTLAALQKIDKNELVNNIISILSSLELRGSSERSIAAIKKASNDRAAATKEKVYDAIDVITYDPTKKMTTYAVAKLAGVSYPTAKKYIRERYKN